MFGSDKQMTLTRACREVLAATPAWKQYIWTLGNNEQYCGKEMQSNLNETSRENRCFVFVWLFYN